MEFITNINKLKCSASDNCRDCVFPLKHGGECRMKGMHGKDICDLNGDTTNDCESCSYSGDYHFVNGECVRRES